MMTWDLLLFWKINIIMKKGKMLYYKYAWYKFLFLLLLVENWARAFAILPLSCSALNEQQMQIVIIIFNEWAHWPDSVKKLH